MDNSKTYEDGSTSLVFPPSDEPTIIVTLCRGLMLPAASRCPAKFNRGETVTLDAHEAEQLIADGWAVRPGDDPNLDETPVPVECLAGFSLRGKSFHAAELTFLPAWFVTKAKALELVGEPPKPIAKPELSTATKAAIENRRVAKRRHEAAEYLKEMIN